MFKRLLKAGATAALMGSSALAADALPAASQPPQIPAQPQAQVQMQQGRIFRFAVPQGWRVTETPNGVDLLSPDGATSASHTVLRGLGQFSAEQLLRIIIASGPQVGMAGIRVVAAQPVPAQGNGQAMLYELTYRFNGIPVRAVEIIAVYNNAGGYFVDAMTLQAPPQTFARDSQMLMQLAQSVMVTNTSEVCMNDRLVQYQPPAVASVSRPSSSNPAGDIIIKGEQERNRIRDNIFQRDTDVRRGQTRWQGADGTQYVAPNTAARVFASPGGQGYYNNTYSAPPPANTTELKPYTYGH